MPGFVSRTVTSVFVCVPFVVLALSLGSLSTAQASWSPNDLSILLPLPASAESEELLHAETEGALGVLIPEKPFLKIPRLAPVFRSNYEGYLSLRAVSFRIDPCFPKVGGGCRKQIRIVWQPLVVGLDKRSNEYVRTVDAAVHTFYDLSDNDFSLLLKEVGDLKINSNVVTDGLSLNVHPAALAQGLKGPFVKGLHRILLSHIGQKNLTRMTFMLVRGPSILWVFGGFDFANGNPSPMVIPRLETGKDDKQQIFINSSATHDDFVQSDIRPAPDGPDTFNLLMGESARISPIEDRSEIKRGLVSILKIENPDFHSPNTMDCVSCHTAQATRTFALNRFYPAGLTTEMRAKQYRSKFNLANTSAVAGATNNLHSFGYFEGEPSISQRTINEAAAVADSLN